MKKRKYTKTRRAEKQDATREKIVEATVHLHETLGPANTSIKAIAELAGVQRLTVYRHFPDEVALFQACTAHYFAQHQPPNPAGWADIADAPERSRTALLVFYRYYRQTEGMLSVAYRDLEQVEALHGPMNRFEGFIDQVRDDLLACWQVSADDKKSLALTLRHCLRFSTWQSLKNEKLSDKKIVELVMGWIV